MATAHAQRLKDYKARMQEGGFKRLSAYICRELVTLLEQERRKGECAGRLLERLLLGQARERPPYWTPAELSEKSEKRDAWKAARPKVPKRLTRVERSQCRKADWQRIKAEIEAEMRRSP